MASGYDILCRFLQIASSLTLKIVINYFSVSVSVPRTEYFSHGSSYLTFSGTLNVLFTFVWSKNESKWRVFTKKVKVDQELSP